VQPERAVAAGICATIAVLASHARAAVETAPVLGLSANWSGYVATGPSFSGVSGSWTVPGGSCLREVTPTAVAFWVGLGGAVRHSKKIEQIGTAVGCSADGSTSYFAWYEFWPKRPVALSLDVERGDRIRASVDLDGDAVVLDLLDVTTGRRFHRRFRSERPDASSAEWIGETPSLKVEGRTALMPLTKFDRVSFSAATATAKGRTASIGDGAWAASRVRLGRLHQAQVVPSRLQRAGSAFSLTLRRS
jgi:hypothetical protein